MTLKSKMAFAAFIMLFTYGEVYAQAFCALRDPVETIEDLFPRSTSQRSIVKVIDQDIRDQVSDKLPPNTLHFGELGRHTLYVIFEEQTPLGFVHVRSEESDWGLVEIAWALETDLSIRDFRFQRCRSRQKKVLEADNFRNQLKGLNFQQVVSLMNSDGATLNEDKIKVPGEAKALAEVVIRCAMKTMLVTKLAWSEEVLVYQAWDIASEKMGAVERAEYIHKPITNDLIAVLDKEFGGASPGVDRQSVQVARIVGEQGVIKGAYYSGDVAVGQSKERIHWLVDSDGTLIDVGASYGWANPQARRMFEGLVGVKLESSEHCTNRAELISLEATMTAEHILSMLE